MIALVDGTIHHQDCDGRPPRVRRRPHRPRPRHSGRPVSRI